MLQIRKLGGSNRVLKFTSSVLIQNINKKIKLHGLAPMNEPYPHQPMEHSTVEMGPAIHEMMNSPAMYHNDL